MGRFSALLLVVGLAVSAFSTAHSQDAARQRDLVNDAVVGVISGGVTGTYIRIAADLADALDRGYELRVLPIVGKGSVRNIEDLLFLRGVDIAIVQSDVLDFYRRAGIVRNIDQKIRYVVKLYNEEIHLLAQARYGSVDDLDGKRVNFGTEGSGTFMTASIIFDELGIDVDVTTYPEPEALERLRQGDIDALVFVGGQPLNLVSSVSPEDDLKLLPLPRERIEAAYVPATLSAGSYPALIPAGQEVPTLAVSAVMAAYNWPRDHPRYAKVERFVDSFFESFEKLQQPPYHAKWREVSPTEPVPGWQRMEPAREALAAQS